MTRVAHLITSLDTGGAQSMLCKLLEATNPAAYPSLVISMVDGGPVAARIRSLGVPVSSLGMRRGAPDPRAIPRLRRILRGFRPDVLQTWLYHADLLGILAGRGAGVPRVLWNLRGTPLDASSRGRLERFSIRACAALSRRPDAVLFNSHAGRAGHAALGYRPARWEWIPNGFDTNLFRPRTGASAALRRRLGIPASSLVAGCFARWHPMKDHRLLLDAFGRMKTADVHLVLAGKGLSSSNGALAHLLEGHARRERIHLLGEQKAVAAWMAGLDFLVSASRCGEGFPNVLGEAMACGTPCVATDVGDSAFVMSDAGLVIPPGDAAALGGAMDRLAGLPEPDREDLGRRARSRVEQEFRLDTVAARFERLYSEFTEGRACAA